MVARAAWFVAAFVVLCGGLVLFPRIDLWAAAQFYEPARGFALADWAPFRILHAASPWIVGLAVAAGAVLLAMPGRWRAGMVLLLALAIGPGLIVNTLFKDHWGRARPSQITVFAGEKRFTPAFVPSDQCISNCSFPAGDPAVGFFLVSAGLLARPPWRRRAVLGALALGAAMGVARMAQGAHFLSDVASSGFLVAGTSWALHRWIIAADGLGALWRRLRHPPPGLIRGAGLVLALALAILAAIAWLDQPVAQAVRGSPAGLVAAFRVITRFGVSTPYLAAAALLAAGFALAARRAAGIARRQALRLRALQAGFVLVAVAGAGLAGDLMKPLFGRTRPKLLFDQGVAAFTWHGAHADHWSFPSGHTITVVALALALTQIERRGAALYGAAALLVMASRIVLDEHYLSDVLAGALVALLGFWAARAAFARALSDSP